MHYTKHAQVRKFPVKFLPLFVFISIIMSALEASAQHRHDAWATFGGGGGGFSDSGYGLLFGAGYDVPAGDLGQTYKAAPAFDLAVVRYTGNFTFSTGLGYHAYQPKQATSTYNDGMGDTSSASYSNYTVISLYVGAAYNVMLGESSKLYFGLNMGTYFTHYSVNSSSAVLDLSADVSYENLYLAPRIGFEFPLSNRLSLGVEAKYNFFTPAGNTEDDPNVGHVYKTYAAGAALIFKL